ncbi:GumC family protein [Parabacteroides distasonis]|uniref:GumC family protein n=1 Tax=Parabacteroides distasonis TaxID=823 RepID=UPI0039B5330A
MDITLYISRFIYRIRHQLVFGTLIITALVAYFSQFLEKKYTVTTSIYTGITSNTGLDDETRPDWQAVNNTYDNLVNLTKSRGTLENVSLKLLALNLMHGDPEIDNLYITANNYKKLIASVPEEILLLVDTTSLDKTVNLFKEYKYSDSRNYLHELFNGSSAFYSYNALSSIIIRRQGNSDLIEIAYTSTDPGITWNTVKLVSEELKYSYNNLRYQTANDIVKYYEEELKKLRVQLNKQENELTDYNVKNSVINYIEQTKAIAHSFADFENRYEETRRNYESSSSIIKNLEQYMDIRTKLVKSNEEFINTLAEVSRISGKITEIETFTSDEMLSKDQELVKYREELRDAEKKIGLITNNINSYKESKEGLAIEGFVQEWLNQTLIQAKAQADLKVLNERKNDFADQYKNYSPIGTRINQQEREIHVTEQSYLEVLHALNMAKMKQKNLQLTSSNLNTISDASYPLFSDKGKRFLLVVAAFIGSIIFIIGLNLVIELLDRTLRDAERARRLTGMNILGAFTGRNSQLKYRGFVKTCNRISAAYACNRLTPYIKKGDTLCINILSLEEKEGKTFISRYFQESWEELGFNVKYLRVGQDIPIDASLFMAEHIDKHIQLESRPDILIVEYPSIQQYGVPSHLLGSSQVNLLVANACRVWKNSDTELVKYLRDITEGTALYLYLNNATREAVEDFTGQLPPQTSMRSFANRMMYMGLTATNTAVK